jgi:hypothetical protein
LLSIARSLKKTVAMLYNYVVLSKSSRLLIEKTD